MSLNTTDSSSPEQIKSFPDEPVPVVTQPKPISSDTYIDNLYDDDDEDDSEIELSAAATERWAPLGATSPPPPPSCSSDQNLSESAITEQLKTLEAEQDQLNSSLLALTNHFAQVQFRLRQVVNAPEGSDKDKLLRELENFAFRGIPDVRGCKIEDAQLMEELSDKEHAEKIAAQREKQQELIEQLKAQLEDLEKYAYETGTADSLPTTMVLEKQKVVIDELRQKIPINLEDFDKLSPEELRGCVDSAIGQIINPIKVKEKLVSQLKTQVQDLERFIQFIQGEASSPGPAGGSYLYPEDSESVGHIRGGPFSYGGKYSTLEDSADDNDMRQKSKRNHHHHHSRRNNAATSKNNYSTSTTNNAIPDNRAQRLQSMTYDIMKRTMLMMQIFVITHLGCGSKNFQKNVLKRTMKGNHWGDLRARVEITIDKVLTLAKEEEARGTFSTKPGDYTSDSDESEIASCNRELISAVRKEFAMALRDLIQHGLMEISASGSTSLTPFGCFSSRRSNKQHVGGMVYGGTEWSEDQPMMHAWDLLLKYYNLKHGREYNDSPARKLSQSFDLSVIGGKAVTAKQTLLSAIGSIVASHGQYKRSSDSHFKAFICCALNSHRLVPWLRLVLRNSHLVEYYYQPWSYVSKTGFEDTFRSLDRLTSLQFDLPMDLAVRSLHTIADAF